MNSRTPLVSRYYNPNARKKIQLALISDLEDWGGAKPLAAFLDRLFNQSGLELEGICKETGESQRLHYYSDESLRKFFKAGAKERAKIKPEHWRYLDVLRTLYRAQKDHFASSGILEEFGFSRIERASNEVECLIGAGKYILRPKDQLKFAKPALLNVKSSVLNTMRVELWVSMSGFIDPLALRDFVKFNHPPRSTFELWEGVGYEVDARANIESMPSLPPPYAAFILRQPRNRTPGAFLAAVGPGNEVKSANIQTTFFDADYEVSAATIETDG